MSLRNGTAPGTYIVATPASYVTTEVLYSGTETLLSASPISTVPPVGTTPGTIIVATPAPVYVTSRVVYSGTEALTGDTTISTVAPSGTTPGTYIVASPDASYVTSTVVYTGTDSLSQPTAVSTIPPVGTNPGTIIVAARYVTSMVDYQGTDPITGPTEVSTVMPSGTAPGTFIIATQAAIFVTSSVQYTGTGTLTGPSAISTIQPVGTQAGTIVIATPAPEPSYVITTIFLTATDAADSATITTIAPSGTLPGTIVVGRRALFVTVVGPYTETTARYRIRTDTDNDTGEHNGHSHYLFEFINIVQLFYQLYRRYRTQYIAEYIWRFHSLYDHEVLLVLFQLIFIKLFVFIKLFHQRRGQRCGPAFIHSSSSSSRITTSSRVVASATRGPAFSCPTTGFLMQTRTLYSLDIATGNRTLMSDNVGGDTTRNINAMGYNAREDYIYGVSQSNSSPYTFRLIRILANGTTQNVATINKFSSTADNLFNSGDIDENGQFWISTGGADYYQYNLNPGTAGYGTLVNSSLLAGTGGYVIGDWTVVPGVGGGDLWSAFTVVRELGFLTGTSLTLSAAPFWGASYATTDGYLYAFENNSGQVWRIAIDNHVPVQRVSTAPVSSQNDGARCLDSANVVISGS
ncbi:hypothetical protein LY78DRAFT_704618 [Colletotrichum sublineola]|nr:hypothetical protein LY78DRAFT_704618 [Colletotrichum sublineola]